MAEDDSRINWTQEDEDAEQLKIPINSLAFVIDGFVQDIIHVPNRLCAILTSNPTIVNITNHSEAVNVGSAYNAADNSFIIDNDKIARPPLED